MTRYSIESTTRKYDKGYGFLSFARNLSRKYRKKRKDTSTKAGVDPARTASWWPMRGKLFL